MSIRAECPACGKVVKAPEKYAGKVAKCPACQVRMRIPVPEAAAVGPSPPPEPAPTPTPQPSAPLQPPPPSSEQDLLSVRPAVFRTRPMNSVFWISALIIGAILSAAAYDQAPWVLGIPAVSLLVILRWFVQSLTTTLRITNKRSILRHGILSKRTREVRHCDVRLLQVDQSFFQRLLKVGRISLASAGHGEVEIMVDGLKNPGHIKETIDGYRP